MPTVMDSDAHITVEDDKIVVRSSYRHKDRCKIIPNARPKFRGEAFEYWWYPATPAQALEVSRAFASVTGVRFDEKFIELWERGREMQAAQGIKSAEDLPEIPGVRNPSWNHQKQAYYFAQKLDACLYAMHMGTGKSALIVWEVCNEKPKNTLIIVPNKVLKENVWANQFRLHATSPVYVAELTDDSRKTPLSVAEKTALAKRAIENAEARREPCVIVINYESSFHDPFASWALSQRWDVVVLDESHRIRSPGAKTGLFCAALGRRARRRRCLTGTPMPHNPLNVYPQYRFLDPGIFGTSFVRFRQRYAVMGGFGGHEIKGYQNEDEFNKKMYSIAFHAGPEVLDLPPYHHVIRTCKLGKDATIIYRDLEKELVADIDGGQVTVTNALTRLLRLQQITGGYITPETGARSILIDTSKRELLSDILEDIDPREPLVIFARFKADLDTIREVVEARESGNKYGELSGRYDDFKTWNMGEVDILGVQIQAGGVGLDMTRAKTAIYYSVGFSLDQFEQSLARVHRPGQTESTTFLHLLVEGTVDEKVYQALKERKDVVAYFMKEIRKQNVQQ
jgi:SNF2 family DNA or RNA helicase